MRGILVRRDVSALEMREWARQENDGRVVRRALAIAHVIDGWSRTKAAEAVGLERQALRDAIHRFNREGWEGLRDRPRSGRPRKLTAAEEQDLEAKIIAGPSLEETGTVEFRIRHLLELAEENYGVRYSASGLKGVLHRLRLSWMTCRPLHPKTDLAAQLAFKEKFPELVRSIAAQNPEATAIEIWFQDEARVGQKGHLTRRWAKCGTRPRALRDGRFGSAWIFGAVCPARDLGVALIFQKANTESMSAHLQEISQQIAPGAHAIIIVDQAGWHDALDLEIPFNITLVPLPPYSPELNAAEKLWQYLRANILSHRVYKTVDDVIDACCFAWTALTREAGRFRSLCSFGWAHG
jgi:transposase